MERSLVGALLLLLLIFLARGPVMVTGMKRPDETGSCAVDSGRTAGRPSPRRSPSSRKNTNLIPPAYTRAPLAFLSRAPVDSLVLLKGIGPVLAERIAEARSGKGRFSSWEEILAIKGIGQKKLESLKKQAGIVD